MHFWSSGGWFIFDWALWVLSVSCKLHLGVFMHLYNPLPWRIPMDRGAWWATVHWGLRESDMTERLNTTFLDPARAYSPFQKWKCTVEVHVRLMGREHSMPWQDLDLTHCHFHLHFTGKNQSQSYTQYQWGGEICSTSRERNCKIIWQSLHIKGGMRYWVQEGRLLNFSLHSSHFS